MQTMTFQSGPPTKCSVWSLAYTLSYWQSVNLLNHQPHTSTCIPTIVVEKLQLYWSAVGCVPKLWCIMNPKILIDVIQFLATQCSIGTFTQRTRHRERPTRIIKIGDVFAIQLKKWWCHAFQHRLQIIVVRIVAQGAAAVVVFDTCDISSADNHGWKRQENEECSQHDVEDTLHIPSRIFHARNKGASNHPGGGPSVLLEVWWWQYLKKKEDNLSLLNLKSWSMLT